MTNTGQTFTTMTASGTSPVTATWFPALTRLAASLVQPRRVGADEAERMLRADRLREDARRRADKLIR